MEFNSVGLPLTDACNARCEMCCAGRPEKQACQHTLTHDELDRVLSELKSIESIKTVGITGGEPMLFPDLVQQVCDYDFGREVKVTLKTNGFWGRDIDQAREALDRMGSRIRYISLSYDQFHHRYVSMDAIKNVIDLAWERGYKTKFGYQPVMRTGLAANIPAEK